MKILIVTQWFDPEPTFKGLFFAKELVNQGHQVEVITGFPNYPGGKLYDGYKIKFKQVEFIDGIKVTRVPVYPSHDNSAMKRILNYTSFFLSSFFCALFKAQKFDVIYAYHPPLTTSLSAALTGKIKRIPVVVDIQDLWPDTLAATGMLNNNTVLKLISKVCILTYKLSTHLVVLSDGFKQELTSRGVPKEKITVIHNWCNEESLVPKGVCKHQLPKDGFNVVFAGNIGLAQGVNAIVESAVYLKKMNSKANIVLVGDGVLLADAKTTAIRLNLENIFFIPRVPMNEVADLLCAADSLLVHLSKNKLFEITIPSRTQAYLYVGKPIIMGVEGDAKLLIEKSLSGYCCGSDNPESLANTINKLSILPVSELDALSKNAKEFYNNELSLKVGASKFITLFEKVTNNA